MSLVSLRPILAPLFGVVICLLVSPRPGAAVKNPAVAQFVARAVSIDATDAGRIEILIERWSTNEDLENLRAALIDSGPGKLLPVFQKARPEAGVLLMPGVTGLGARARQRRTRPLQFAREIETPAGRQVVVATDQHLGFGEGAREAPPPAPEFTLLDIRFGPDGKGVGKMAPAANVVYNKVKKIFEIENYTAQPVRLIEVQSAKP